MSYTYPNDSNYGNLTTTNRQYRLYSNSCDTKYDESKHRDILKFSDICFKKGVKIDGQKLTLDFSEIYPDDALAVIRNMIILLNKGNPDKHNEKALFHIQRGIYEMDKRAVERHGYSNNKEEAELELPADYNDECVIELHRNNIKLF